MFYTAYGLTIKSQLALPELAGNGQEDAPDLSIELGFVSEHGFPEEGKQLRPDLWVSPEKFWLQVPQIARFLISNGKQILIDAEPGIDEDSLRLFLLGSVFGALLYQRGYLVLHGNAIRIDDQCMICVGNSGAGKSTLAAGFLRRGYEILADDVAPVDAVCRVLPGFPRIKLWQDVADKLNIETIGLRRIRPGFDKFNLPISVQDAKTPIPLRWIYALGSNDIDDISVTPINGAQRFKTLYKNTYQTQFLDGVALKYEHLQFCGGLSNKLRLAHVTRPRCGFHLDAMIDRILADISDNS